MTVAACGDTASLSPVGDAAWSTTVRGPDESNACLRMR
jgi:hypothetical protein